MPRSVLRAVLLPVLFGARFALADQPVVNIYNWSDYFAEDTLQRAVHIAAYSGKGESP